MRLPPGMRQFEKETVPCGQPLMPMSSSAVTESPAAAPSTQKRLMFRLRPEKAVRAATMQALAVPALVIHDFAPFSTHSPLS